MCVHLCVCENILSNLNINNYCQDGYIGIILIIFLTASLFAKIYMVNICSYLIQKKNF